MSMLYNTLKNGFTVLRSNNRLLFVVVLMVVFPALFIAVVQSFFTTAYSNIETSEKRQVAVLHDALSVLISAYGEQSTVIGDFITKQVTENSELVDIRVLKKTDEGLLILQSKDEAKHGSYEQNTDDYEVVQPTNDTSLIFESHNGTYRTWRAVRGVTLQNGTQYYILSEHSFSTIDSVMAARAQQSYIVLTAIFLFLIALAYWFAKQTDWKRRYHTLEQQQKERDLFTNMIAHEFRTPLTAVRGYTSFLQESATVTGQDKKFVEIIQLSTNRLVALVNDFLEIARIQSGKTVLTMVDADVQLVIKEVLTTLTPQAREKQLQLIYTPLKVPLVLTTDTKRLYQVLLNLISNAIKYTKVGTIEITTDVTPKTVTIRIKDTGMGITAEDQKRLFTPFARFGGVETTTTPGTGLGMTITKQYVELLRGTIAVESIKNVGTHVVLTFKR